MDDRDTFILSELTMIIVLRNWERSPQKDLLLAILLKITAANIYLYPIIWEE